MKVWASDGIPGEVTVRGISRTAWAELVDAHPPIEGEADWNHETFPPALIAACTGFSEVEAAEWWDETTPDSADDVFTECLRLSAPGSLTWAVHLLHRNTRLAAEVGLCVQMGISHDVFTTWSPRAQDLALGSTFRAADTCPGCGCPSEAMTDQSKAEVVSRICFQCRDVTAANASMPEEARGWTHLMVIPTSDGAL